MNKMIVNKYGGPENLFITKVDPVPVCNNLVKIKVAAAGVNFADILVIKGRYQERPRPPFSPGLEISGTVVQIGDKVSNFRIGDKVMGIMKYGGYTQEILLPEDNIYPIITGMDMYTAAGFPVVYGTAYSALVSKANIKPKDNCLILGASGGVGLACIEIAKAMESYVIAAGGSKEKLEVCIDKGADGIINYNEEKFRFKLKKAFEKGIDVVVDLVGGEIAIDAVKSLGWNGRIVIVGFASGKIPSIPSNRLLLNNANAYGLYWGELAYREPKKIGDDYNKIAKWYKEGKINPTISKKLKLDKAYEALSLLVERKVSGKIILEC